MAKKSAGPPSDKAPSRSKGPSETEAGVSAFAQNRLIEAQATIERDYVALRELESRYRYLLQTAADPIAVVATATMRIVDVNAAACDRLQASSDQLVGAPVARLVDAKSATTLQERLDGILKGVAQEPFTLVLADGGSALVTPALFRQDGAPIFMIRFKPAGRQAHAAREPAADTRLAQYVGAAPDAMVLTDRAGVIVQANDAFVELVQVPTERQVRGASLGRWLGRTSVDLGVLLSNLKQRGKLKLFATHLRAEYGTLTEVEISAAQLGEGPDAFLGFTIRDVGRRLPPAGPERVDIARSVDQMTELVGRVPMKDIVGNTTGLIEQMCIKAALELTRNNRAAAAELLGLSRQSLYVKLRLYRMLDTETDDA